MYRRLQHAALLSRCSSQLEFFSKLFERRCVIGIEGRKVLTEKLAFYASIRVGGGWDEKSTPFTFYPVIVTIPVKWLLVCPVV